MPLQFTSTTTAKLIAIGSPRTFLTDERTITAAGDVTVAASDYLIRLNKTISATTNVILPASSTRTANLFIKDAKGDGNFLLVPAGSEDVDGVTAAAGGYPARMTYDCIELHPRESGTGWDIVSIFDAIDRPSAGFVLLDYIPVALHAGIADGTNTTDLTVYCAAAIADMPTKGGQLFFPAGEVRVSSIVINKPGLYCGAGRGATTASNSSTIIKGTTAADHVISITSSTGGVKLQDLGVTSTVAAASRTGSGVKINAGPSILIERVYSTGHLRGFLCESPGVEFRYTNSTANSGAGYLFDGTVASQDEIGLYCASSDSNLGDGFAVNGHSTGLWAYRLISVANGGVGFKALKTGGAGYVNDVYLTDPEISGNTSIGVDFSSNNGGAYLTIEGGLIESSTTLINLGTGFSGAVINNVIMGDHGTGVFNNAADVVISNNIISNSTVTGIELGPTSTGAILTGNKSKAQGATPFLALNVDVGASSFVGVGNDWSSATTARAGGGGMPAGSYYVNNKGDSSVTGTAGKTFTFFDAIVVGASGTLGSITFGNATSGTIKVQPVTGALGTVTLSYPAATDTLVGKATTDTLTNKTFDTAGTGNSFSINSVAATANTGTGAVARASSPVFVTPTLGVASATGVLCTGPTNGVGYGTGAGGTVTQGTSRTTGVTVNTVTGAITLFSAAGSATPASFTVTNSAVAATDVVIVNQKSGTDLYELFITAVAAGSFRITFFTTGGTTTEQPVFNFAVIKGVTS